jgi:hypothetical protein
MKKTAQCQRRSRCPTFGGFEKLSICSWFQPCFKKRSIKKQLTPSLAWVIRRFMEWAFGAIQPIGHHKRAKNDKHDDEDVFDFHGVFLVLREDKKSRKK